MNKIDQQVIDLLISLEYKCRKLRVRAVVYYTNL